MEESVKKFSPVIILEISLSNMALCEGLNQKTFSWIKKNNYTAYIEKEMKLIKYTWPKERIMNIWLIPELSKSSFMNVIQSILID